jgi:dTDP-4-amino-4,6-dideoxygalactose transaminase
MERIHQLSKQYGFKVIEDASHAIGGKYKGEPIGNCCYSDITVFSFHPVKISTTGEGGMAVTNNKALAKHMQLLRSHGISNALSDMNARPPLEVWNYQQIDLGFNYRMNDIQAALGLSQMHRLDQFVSKRNVLAERYNQLLSIFPVEVPWQNKDCYSSYHLYVIRLKLNEIKKSQRQIYQEIRDAGVLINLHYIPVYRQPYYENRGFVSGYCIEAEKYYTEVISIPLYSALTEEQQNRVVTTICKVIQL